MENNYSILIMGYKNSQVVFSTLTKLMVYQEVDA